MVGTPFSISSSYLGFPLHSPQSPARRGGGYRNELDTTSLNTGRQRRICCSEHRPETLVFRWSISLNLTPMLGREPLLGEPECHLPPPHPPTPAPNEPAAPSGRGRGP